MMLQTLDIPRFATSVSSEVTFYSGGEAELFRGLHCRIAQHRQSIVVRLQTIFVPCTDGAFVVEYDAQLVGRSLALGHTNRQTSTSLHPGDQKPRKKRDSIIGRF